jgi:hypothetical protein
MGADDDPATAGATRQLSDRAGPSRRREPLAVPPQHGKIATTTVLTRSSSGGTGWGRSVSLRGKGPRRAYLRQEWLWHGLSQMFVLTDL